MLGKKHITEVTGHSVCGTAGTAGLTVHLQLAFAQVI